MLFDHWEDIERADGGPIRRWLRQYAKLQFEPEARASYDLSAKVLNIIKASGVTKFGFVGNEQYRVFGKAG